MDLTAQKVFQASALQCWPVASPNAKPISRIVSRSSRKRLHSGQCRRVVQKLYLPWRRPSTAQRYGGQVRHCKTADGAWVRCTSLSALFGAGSGIKGIRGGVVVVHSSDFTGLHLAALAARPAVTTRCGISASALPVSPRTRPSVAAQRPGHRLQCLSAVLLRRFYHCPFSGVVKYCAASLRSKGSLQQVCRAVLSARSCHVPHA
jgi:hypothetical protein